MEEDFKLLSKKIGKTIRKERKKKKLSQEQLGKKIGVVGKQISTYELGKIIPPIDNLIALCKEFNCELGYLLGEEDYSEGTKLLTSIYNYTGLNEATIKNICYITGTQKNCLNFGNESEKYRELVNNFLSDSAFCSFIECLEILDRNISSINKDIEDLKNSLFHRDEDLVTEAIRVCFDPTISYEYDEEYSAKHPELLEPLFEINKIIELIHNREETLQIEKYKFVGEFAVILDELYPKDSSLPF